MGDSSTSNSYYYESGMRILIHNSSLDIPLVYENGISLAPGFNYHIKVDRTFYSRLEDPYSDCIKDLSNKTSHKSFIMNVMFDALGFTTYNKQYCENLIFQGVYKFALLVGD